jgi:hypothetical protein
MKTPREILLERHQTTESKLDAIRENVVARLSERENKRASNVRPWAFAWLDLFHVPRWAWGSLAAAWLVIGALNIASSDVPSASVSVAQVPAKRSPEMRQALLEQKRLFAELVGTLSAPADAEAPRFVPRPRSEVRPQLVFT